MTILPPTGQMPISLTSVTTFVEPVGVQEIFGAAELTRQCRLELSSPRTSAEPGSG